MMQKKNGRHGPRLFIDRMQKKLVVLYLLVLLAFGVLIARLFMINYNNGADYTKQVLSQQSYDSREIPFKRGTITDAKGTVLATSTLVYNIVIDSYQINHGPKNDKGVSSYYEPTLNALERLGLDRSKMEAYVKDNPDNRYYIVKKNFSYDDKKTYDKEISDASEKLKELNKKLASMNKSDARYAAFQKEQKAAQEKVTEYSNIQGITFEPAYIRSYPEKTMASHVIGFANTSNEGNFGLEEYYNDILNGTPGREYGYLNDSSNLERTTVEPTDGDNLVLTLDANIQSIIEKYLQEFNDTYQDGAHNGYGANNVGCIIEDVTNGDILGMASYPNFDLNNPYEMSRVVGLPKLDDKDAPTDEYMTQADVDALTTDEEKSRYLNYLWRNFCISDYYEPGSVAKPFTLAAGLESGKLTGNETYFCDGSLEVGGWQIKCHSYANGGDGELTVDQAIERSCNVALMQMALTTGIDNFCKFQHIFGFGLKTNIDLAKEARTDTLLIDKDKMTETDLATNSFGQNFDTTMIQMIAGFSSLINGGNYWQPHLVKKITTSSGSTVKNIEPRLLRKTVSEATSAKIREATLAVVAGENGTGHTARPAGYMIGGKTGTAETIPRGNGEYVVSFMGYAPADDPKIAIYVVVDRANTHPQDDAKYATKIVRKILTEVLPYLNIYMTEPLSDEEKKELEQMNLEDTLAYSADTISQLPVAIKDNLDTDGDGVMDAVDGDGDGKADTAVDSNGDGITDAVDTDGDGKADLYDTDNDGVVDSDKPKAGATDITQTKKSTLIDTDGDSVPDTAASQTPVWKSYPVDEKTGYYIEPGTGKLIDPESGYVYEDTTMGDQDGKAAGGADAVSGTSSSEGTDSTGTGADGTNADGTDSTGGNADGTGTTGTNADGTDSNTTGTGTDGTGVNTTGTGTNGTGTNTAGADVQQN